MGILVLVLVWVVVLVLLVLVERRRRLNKSSWDALEYVETDEKQKRKMWKEFKKLNKKRNKKGKAPLRAVKFVEELTSPNAERHTVQRRGKKVPFYKARKRK